MRLRSATRGLPMCCKWASRCTARLGPARSAASRKADPARDRSGVAVGSVSLKSGIGYSIPAPVIRDWLTQHQLTFTTAIPTFEAPPRAEPDAARSFATGHVLQMIAGVLQQDIDLLNLAIYHYEAAAALRPDASWITK